MPIQLPVEKWNGAVREVTLGAGSAEGGSRSRTVTVGGETTLPFLHFEGKIPHLPQVAFEIKSRRPADWSPLLLEAWGKAANHPADWAAAAERAGADLLLLTLDLADSAADAQKAVAGVLQATGLPLIVFGPGQVEKDNELIVAVAPRRPKANGWCWACARKRTTARLWPLPWPTAIWSTAARRWM